MKFLIGVGLVSMMTATAAVAQAPLIDVAMPNSKDVISLSDINPVDEQIIQFRGLERHCVYSGMLSSDTMPPEGGLQNILAKLGFQSSYTRWRLNIERRTCTAPDGVTEVRKPFHGFIHFGDHDLPISSGTQLLMFYRETAGTMGSD